MESPEHLQMIDTAIREIVDAMRTTAVYALKNSKDPATFDKMLPEMDAVMSLIREHRRLLGPYSAELKGVYLPRATVRVGDRLSLKAGRHDESREVAVLNQQGTRVGYLADELSICSKLNKQFYKGLTADAVVTYSNQNVVRVDLSGEAVRAMLLNLDNCAWIF
jgi:hypothetical protein